MDISIESLQSLDKSTFIYIILLLVPPFANFSITGICYKYVSKSISAVMSVLCISLCMFAAINLFLFSSNLYVGLANIFSFKCHSVFDSNLIPLCSKDIYIPNDVDQFLKVSWGIYLDELSKIMLIIISVVSFIVHLYSSIYMYHDTSFKRFMAYISFFTFVMIVLVVSNNFIQLFVGWELVGVTSYLLIGFWYQKKSATRAAIKAFVVNRVSDIFLLIAIILMSQRNNIYGISDFGMNIANIHMTYLEAMMLLIGCMGKSAQIFLHVWLPDAMEGPTPASALIHAATMVTAGVFLLVRVNVQPYDIIAMVGLMTAIFGATTALAQNDFKKIIAYSTCSQLGYMFISVGVGCSQNAIFHLCTHAFFKALLFLSAGNVIHCARTSDVTKMGGIARKMPITFIFFMIGVLSLVGLPPFSGYYSKDAILEGANYFGTSKLTISDLVNSSNNDIASVISHKSYTGKLLYNGGLFAAFVTALYSIKMICLVFLGKTKISDNIFKFITEPSVIMLFAQSVLACGAIFSGIYFYYCLDITNPGAYFNFSHSDFVYIPYHDHVPMLFGLSGLILGYCAYRYNFSDRIKSKLCVIHSVLKNKYFFDEIYYYTLVYGTKKIGDFVNVLESNIDKYLVKNNISSVKLLNKLVKKVNNGILSNYIMHFILFVVCVSGFFAYNYIYSPTGN